MGIGRRVVLWARCVAALIGCIAGSLFATSTAAASSARQPAAGVVGVVPVHLGSSSGATSPFDQPLSAATFPAVPPPDGGGGPVIYNGGPVMASNTNYVVVWTPQGYSGAPFQTGYVSGVDQYFRDIAAASGSTTFNDSVASQYNDATGATAGGVSTFGGESDDTDALPANGCSAGTICLTDSQLQSELKTFLASKGLSGGPTSEYFVLTPPGVVSCLDDGTSCSTNSFCAYHGYTGGTSGYVYADIPDLAGSSGCDPFYIPQSGSPCSAAPCSYPNGPADGMLWAVSNAHNEATTDPEPATGWSLDPSHCSGGIPCGIVNNCAFNELTDPHQTASNGAPYNMTINGDHYWLQPLWSNQGQACVDSWSSNGNTATASFTVSPQGGNQVTFDASGSTSAGSGAASGILGYAWEFNDDATTAGGQTGYVEANFGHPTVTRIFPGPGTYTVALTVLLGDGTSSGTSEQVTVSSGTPPPAPTVTGLSPSFGPSAGATTVTIAGTNLAGVTAVKFGSKLAHFVQQADGTLQADSPPGAGSVDVTVTTAGGSSATSAADRFLYGPVAPVAGFGIFPSPVAGSAVTFDAAGSSDPNPGGSITSYSWNFGDGTAPGTGARVSHTYTAAGTYNVTLTVVEFEGQNASVTHAVTVAPASTGTGTTTTTTTPTGQPPVNAVLPQISGNPVVGSTLTASTGTWGFAPTSLTYQWEGCDSHGNCHNVAGATGTSYVPVAPDLNTTLHVSVTAANAFGSASATSAPTIPVGSDQVPVTTGAPQTSGDTAVVPEGCQDGFILVCVLFFNFDIGHYDGPPPPPPSSGPARVDAVAARVPAAKQGGKRHPKPKPKRKVIVVGSAKASIPRGSTADVKVGLNRTGKRLLAAAKNHKLNVKLVITMGGKTVGTRTIVFTAKPPGKHKKKHG